MKYTNKYDLPEPLFRALTRSEYDKGESDITVTELMKSPRQRLLAIRHDKDVEIDASSRLWSLLGTAVHNVIERETAGPGVNALAEERLYASVNGPRGLWRLGGKFDLLSLNNRKVLTISDHKVAGVYAFLLEKKNGMVKPEWEAQLNVLRWLAKVNGWDVDYLEISGIIRDWKKGDLLKAEAKGEYYPPCPVLVVQVPRWPLKKVEEWVLERVGVHQKAMDTPDDELPHCTPEERWERGECWAVKKTPNAPKAIPGGIHQDLQSAANMAKEVRGIVEHRPGICAKCDPEYCYGAPWCSWYKQMVQGKEACGAKK